MTQSEFGRYLATIRTRLTDELSSDLGFLETSRSNRSCLDNLHGHSVSTPFLKRPSWSIKVRGGATFNESLFNSVNILLGVGLLSVPFAIHEGGWAALLVLALLGAATNFTGKLIVRCQEKIYAGRTELCTPMGTYEDIGQAAFGDWGRQFITLVLYTELIGTCGLFFILEGDHLAALLHIGPESKAALMMAAALVMVPLASPVVFDQTLPLVFISDVSLTSFASGSSSKSS
eukprot:1701041-Pyramimonas_sp.AAC.1